MMKKPPSFPRPNWSDLLLTLLPCPDVKKRNVFGALSFASQHISGDLFAFARTFRADRPIPLYLHILGCLPHIKGVLA